MTTLVADAMPIATGQDRMQIDSSIATNTATGTVCNIMTWYDKCTELREVSDLSGWGFTNGMKIFWGYLEKTCVA